MTLPVAPIALDPGVGVAKRFSAEAGAPHAPVAFDPGQPGALEHPDVLRDRWQRHVEAGRELADGAVAGSEASEDLATGGVGECAEGGVERCVMVNHMV